MRSNGYCLTSGRYYGRITQVKLMIDFDTKSQYYKRNLTRKFSSGKSVIDLSRKENKSDTE